jgi:hypothetical protein
MQTCTALCTRKMPLDLLCVLHQCRLRPDSYISPSLAKQPYLNYSVCYTILSRFHSFWCRNGTRSSVMLEALCYKPVGRGVRVPMKWIHFLSLPNLSGRTSPWGLLSLWQKWVERCRFVGLTTLSPSVSQLSSVGSLTSHTIGLQGLLKG